MTDHDDEVSQARADIIHVCRRIYARGYVASNDGNVSARIAGGRVLITPTGRSKGFLEAGDLILVDMEGHVLEGKGEPSSEATMHLELYRARPDVGAVVHDHPVAATAFAVAGIPLTTPVLPEIILTLGLIPLVEYGCPGTPELPEKILPLARNHDAFLLENHGALTLGDTVLAAYHRMESVEHFAQIALAVRHLGGARPLPPDRVQELMDMRAALGLKGRNPLAGDKG